MTFARMTRDRLVTLWLALAVILVTPVPLAGMLLALGAVLLSAFLPEDK